MSIQPHQGILNIPNATLRVGKLAVDSTAGFDTFINVVERNTTLLEDVTEYTGTKQWDLKLPNIWVATFEIQGISSFNFQNTSVGTAVNGYTLLFSGTTLTLKYDDGNLTTATIPNLDSVYGKVYVTFEKQYFTVTIDGTRVLAYKDTVARTAPQGGEFINFFDTSGAFKNLKIVAGNWISDGTSNVALMGGKLGIGTDTPEDTLHVNGGIRFGGHIIPTTNATFDIGSAEKKIRDMYVDTNSLWIGDTTKIAFSGGKLKFKRRKVNKVPRMVITLATDHVSELTTEAEVETHAVAFAHAIDSTITEVADLKLEHWRDYTKTFDPTKAISDIFVDNDEDYEAVTASEAFVEVGSDIYSAHNISIGKTTAPTSALDVAGTVTATALVGTNLYGTLLGSNAASVSSLTASGDVAFDTNTLFVDSTENRVGIGTNAPNTLLEISSATGSATITPTELRISTTTNASDWSTTDSWGKLSFYSADTSNGGPVARGAIGMSAIEAFGGYSRLGLFTESTGTLAERLTISHDGNVGIGTTSPQNKLAVVGNVTFGAGAATTTSAYHAGMLNVIGGGTRALLRIENNSSVGSPGIIFGEGGVFTEDTVPTIKKVQGTNNLAIMTSGNVGIGTTTPNFPLTIQETTTNTNTVTYPLALRAISSGTVDDGFGVGLRFQCERRDTDDYNGQAGSVEVYGTNIPGTGDRWNMRFGVRNDDTAVTPMTLQYDGNVGIGTDSPSNSLHVYKAAAEATSGLLIEKASGGIGTAASLLFSTNAVGENPGVAKAGIFFERTATNGRGDIQFCVDNVDNATGIGVSNSKMTVRGDGNVGIGTTGPLATLDVNGSSKYRGNLYLAPGTLETNTKVGTKDTFLIMNHSTYSGSLGPNYPLPECGTIMTNRSGAGTFPWLMYTGIVKDVATTTPATSLRMDWGQGSSTGTATDLVDATLNPLMTLRFNGNVGIGTTDPSSTLEVHGTGIHIQGTVLRAMSAIGTVASGAYYKLCDFNALSASTDGVCAIRIKWGGGSEGGTYRYWQGHAAGIVSFNTSSDGAGTYNAAPSEPVTLNHHYHHRAVGPLTFIIDSDNSGSSYGRHSIYVAPAAGIDSMSFEVIALPLRR